MTKSSSSSRVKRASDEKNLPLKEKLVNLTKAVVTSGVLLVVHVILGIICIQQCRIAQSGLLPTCASTKPYTDNDIEMEQVHMDFLTTSDKGVDKSIKATYPIKENLAIYQESTLLRTIRNWTMGSESSNITYYMGSCMSAAALTYYSVHNSMYGFINSWLPQWLIMYMSFTIIPIIFQTAGFCAFVMFAISSIANWSMLLELPEIDAADPTRKWWRPDTGIWTWPSTPSTIFVLICVMCCIPYLCGAGIGLAIMLGLSALLTKPQLFYSKKEQIDQLFSEKSIEDHDTTSYDNERIETEKLKRERKADNDTVLGKNENIEPETPDPDPEDPNQPTQTGGGDSSESDSGEDDENGEDNATKPSPKEEKEDAEKNCLKSNKTTSKKKEKFSTMDQIKLTFKIYRHIIMIIMTIYMLKDIYITMGTHWLLSGIFAVIIMAHFTKVYHKYKISACDNFTEDLIGYQNSYRKCDLIPGEPHKEEEVKRAGFEPTVQKFVKMFKKDPADSPPPPKSNPTGDALALGEAAML